MLVALATILAVFSLGALAVILTDAITLKPWQRSGITVVEIFPSDELE